MGVHQDPTPRNYGRAQVYTVTQLCQRSSPGLFPCVFLQLPEHQLHAGDGVLTAVMAANWNMADLSTARVDYTHQL